MDWLIGWLTVILCEPHTQMHRGLQLRVVGAAVVAASVRSLLECPIGTYVRTYAKKRRHS